MGGRRCSVSGGVGIFGEGWSLDGWTEGAKVIRSLIAELLFR